MITAGIRYLIRRARRDAEFVQVDMLRRWQSADHEKARACDLLVLCGNPRFDLGSHEWLYEGLINAMRTTGVPIIDGWAGGSTGYGGSVEDDAARLLVNPRNRTLLDHMASFRAVITRDDRAQLVCEMAGVPAVRMPCSSWWAPPALRVRQQRNRWRRAVVVIQSNDHMIIEQIRAFRATHEIVATVRQDADWCASIGVRAQLIYDPGALCRYYSECDELYAYRIHAAIPAARLGARVAVAAIDTRAQVCDDFGIPWGTFREHLPEPRHATNPREIGEEIARLIG